MEIRGKTAIVTGGAVRVGKEISLMLARSGANVVINYHSSGLEAEETAQQARTFGVDALPVQADVSDYAQVQQMARAIETRFGGVDIIVNSASHFAKTPLLRDEPANHEAWQRVTRVLIDGPWFVCNALVPGMLERGGGVVINISDLAAIEPWRGFAAHGAGKAALVAFTKQLALELAPKVRANAIAPGYVMPPPNHDEKRVAAAAERTLMGEIGKPEDVALAAKYLIEADFVTGELLVVDGGERLWRGASKS